MRTYYYRSGQRIPVIVSDVARAVRVAGEREPVTVEGWFPRSLTSDHVLLVQHEFVPTERAPVDASALLKLIGQEEKAQARVRNSPAAKSNTNTRRAAEALSQRADLVTFPVAVKESGDGLLIPTGEVVAQFPPNVTREQVEELARLRHWAVVRSLHFLPNGYVLRASISDDPFAFANELVERQGAVFAHPAFLEDIPDRSNVASRKTERDVAGTALPRPALYGRQWHLANAGQGGGIPGQDIDAERAWSITTGSPSVTVCVIDSGTSASHECFQGAGKVVPGYDFLDSNADPAPTSSSHGTACAALAVAGAGQVLGVAFNCRLMPIRRSGLDDHLKLAEAVVFAADHGADVISCSFGIDGEPWLLPDVVRAAFEYATTRGRRGRGIPILFAAGNGNELVSSDEWASSKYTIAVAASNDQARKAPYSDFGPEISVCAPSSGGATAITTAANLGYTSFFGGTSAAAPIAAGVAALVLSVAPNLTWTEVRDVLRAGARKIDPARAQYDARGHSNIYGYGQVDAFQALHRIPALLEIERATDTAALHASILDFVAWLRRRPAGHVIASFGHARRLGILLLLQSSPSFRDAVERVMRVMAGLAPQLAAGHDVTIPEQAWPAIELAARSVKALREDPRAAEGTDRSVTRKRKDHMPKNRNGIDDALGRIAAILGNPPSAGGAPVGTATPAGSGPRPPQYTIQPFPHTDPADEVDPRRRQLEEVSRHVYYSMQFPPITREGLLQMEADLPTFTAYLRSLNGRPAARTELKTAIDGLMQPDGSAERSAEDQQRLLMLIQGMSRDAFGDTGGGERNPGILIAIASVALGYQLGKGIADRQKAK